MSIVEENDFVVNESILNKFEFFNIKTEHTIIERNNAGGPIYPTTQVEIIPEYLLSDKYLIGATYFVYTWLNATGARVPNTIVSCRFNLTKNYPIDVALTTYGFSSQYIMPKQKLYQIGAIVPTSLNYEDISGIYEETTTASFPVSYRYKKGLHQSVKSGEKIFLSFRPVNFGGAFDRMGFEFHLMYVEGTLKKGVKI